MSPETPTRWSLLLLFSLCNAAVAAAEEVRLAPSLTLQQEYSDNIFFATVGKERSFCTTVAPALALSSRSERLEARLSARMNASLYEGKSALNSLDQAYSGGLDYRLAPTLKLGLAGDFARESRPDRSIEAAGLVEVTKDSRQLYTLSGESLWNEKTVSSVAYSFERVDYDRRSDLDSRSHTADLGLVHDLSLYLPGAKGRGNFGFNRNLFSTATVVSYSATIGASYALHELWTVTADAGGRYTRVAATSEQITSQGGQNPRGASAHAGWVANLALAYRGEFSGASLAFLRNVTVASGLGGAAERTAVVLDLRGRPSSQLSTGASAGYYLNQSAKGEFSAQPIDERTVRISPFIRYEFSPDLALDASYQYTWVSYRLSDTTAGQNRILIRLVGRWQLLE